MAWPTTPLTTYVASSAPAIKASDLNAFQSAINAAFLGTLSFKGLSVDGSGGLAVTPPSGTVVVSSLAGGTTTPSPAMTNFAVYKDMIPFCVASVTFSGGVTPALAWGINAASVTASANAVFTIGFNNNSVNYATSYAVFGTTGLSGSPTNGSLQMVQLYGMAANGVAVKLVKSSDATPVASGSWQSFSVLVYTT